MSIINEALKKAANEQRLSPDQPAQILNKIAGRKWFIWTLTGVICFLGAIVVINLFKYQRPQEVPQAAQLIQEPIVQVEAAPKVNVPLTTLAPAKEVVQIPKVVPLPSESANFNLSGILFDQQKPLAIINQRVVSVGMLVNGARLLEIHPDYVRLSQEGKEFILELR